MLEFIQYFVLTAIAIGIVSYIIVEVYSFVENKILDCFDFSYNLEY